MDLKEISIINPSWLLLRSASTMTYSLPPSSLNPMPKWFLFNLQNLFSKTSQTHILSCECFNKMVCLTQLFSISHFFYHTMINNNQVQISNFIFSSVLKAYSGFDLGIGGMVHWNIIKNGFERDFYY